MDIKLVHALSVLLFLASFLVKTTLLVSGNRGMLEWYTRSFRFVDMGLSLLFLGTGIYLWSQWDFLFSITWFSTKFILILIAIPVGIIALRRESKALGILASLLFIYITIISYSKTNLF